MCYNITSEFEKVKLKSWKDPIMYDTIIKLLDVIIDLALNNYNGNQLDATPLIDLREELININQVPEL